MAGAMTAGSPIFGALRTGPEIEVLDLRHFAAAQLRPLLRDEAALWQQRLQWDYTSSVELLLEYLDGRVLPGYVATQRGHVMGYTFSVLEGAKAVIGDAYAFGETLGLNNPVCDLLLHHLIEMLQATPGVDRIESQLLMFPVGALAGPFLSRGFRGYPRLFMMGDADGLLARARKSGLGAPADLKLPAGLRLENWRPEFFDAAAELIHRSYAGHMDSGINDQYRSVHGSLRFLHNIIRFPGCGAFDAANSWVLRDERNQLQALLLSSRVQDDVGHVTQLCVTPALRGLGLGRLLLQQAARQLVKRGAKALSLTVTEANVAARTLYDELGFEIVRKFEAMVWDGE
jgi:ribosomal protein S18 acetylase RimI-like enzyme